MTILALDLARHTGWAVALDEAIAQWPLGLELEGATGPIDGVEYGMEHFKAASHGKLFCDFRDWLARKIKIVAPDQIIAEAPISHHTSRAGAAISLGLKTQLEMLGHIYKVDIYEEFPPTIKKHWTGNGRAKKPEMIAMCQNRGWSPQDDNAADALALLDLAVHRLHGPGK